MRLSACLADSSLPDPPAQKIMGPSGTFLVASRKQRPHPRKKSPGTASACEGLIELGSCDRVPRNNGVQTYKIFFSYARGNKRYFVL